MRHGGAPDGRECGVGAEHVSELGDALSGVRALATIIEATQLVVVQAAHMLKRSMLGASNTCLLQVLGAAHSSARGEGFGYQCEARTDELLRRHTSD